MQKTAYDSRKLKTLIHYVIKSAGPRPRFGAVKLYKVAWFSDAKFYLLNGRPITGASYVRERYGPVPRDAMRIRRELVNEGAISEQKGPEYEGWKFRALANPDLSVFNADELQTINYWIKHIDKDHTAESISDESHDYGWEIAAMHEELPFHAFLASRIHEPDQPKLERMKARAAELGLI